MRPRTRPTVRKWLSETAGPRLLLRLCKIPLAAGERSPSSARLKEAVAHKMKRDPLRPKEGSLLDHRRHESGANVLRRPFVSWRRVPARQAKASSPGECL